MCVAVRRAFFTVDTPKYRDGLARRMADVKSEISRIFDVKYLTFSTSKNDFLVAVKAGPNGVASPGGSPQKLSLLTSRSRPPRHR